LWVESGQGMKPPSSSWAFPPRRPALPPLLGRGTPGPALPRPRGDWGPPQTRPRWSGGYALGVGRTPYALPLRPSSRPTPPPSYRILGPCRGSLFGGLFTPPHLAPHRPAHRRTALFWRPSGPGTFWGQGGRGGSRAPRLEVSGFPLPPGGGTGLPPPGRRGVDLLFLPLEAPPWSHPAPATRVPRETGAGCTTSPTPRGPRAPRGRGPWGRGAEGGGPGWDPPVGGEQLFRPFPPPGDWFWPPPLSDGSELMGLPGEGTGRGRGGPRCWEAGVDPPGAGRRRWSWPSSPPRGLGPVPPRGAPTPSSGGLRGPGAGPSGPSARGTTP
jgi:hypothetical protein